MKLLKKNNALFFMLLAIIGYSGLVFGDTKIADSSANFGTVATARKPDAVLEVVGGGGVLGDGSTKPSFLIRSTDNGVNGINTGSSSLIVTGTGNIGIGTSTPAGALDIQSTTGTFVMPRMSQAQRDALVSPPTGAMIFNTTANNIYYNIGTPSVPNWVTMLINSATSGAEVSKVVYVAASSDPSKTVTSGRFEFRIGSSSVPQFRLTSAPAANVTVSYHTMQNIGTNGYGYSSQQRTFTSANWDVWQDCATGAADGMTTAESNEVIMNYPGDDNIWKIKFAEAGSGSTITFSILAEKF